MTTATPPVFDGTVPVTRSLNPTSHVAPDVVGLRSVMVNVYFVGTPERWVLIDAGLPISGPAIRAKAAELFGDTPPRAILLTHGHFDHVGVLKTLAEAWDVPVFAHPLEMPYLNGTAGYAPPDPWVGGSMALVSRLYPRGPVDLSPRLRTLPVDGSVPFLDGWRWLHTPGHAPGHVSFFRDEDGVLVAGDAFVTTRQESLVAVALQTQHVYGPPRYFTHDWPAAESSVKRLAALDVRVAATGHGTPMRGERLRDQLADLAEHFAEREVPPQGRYAGDPVVADENGPERVPAPRPIPPAALALGVGVAAGALTLAALLASRTPSKPSENSAA